MTTDFSPATRYASPSEPVRVASRSLLTGLLLVMLYACATTPPDSAAGTQANPPLRVGVTPDYPPLVFQANQAVYTSERDLRGIEIDFARKLASALARPPEFVVLPWEQQIPALLQHKIDIIMSGMTITAERRQQIAFSGPYLDITLAALVRTEDYRRYRASGNTIPPFTKVGVQGGTTGEQYIHQTLPGINIITLVDNTAAASELARYSIDAFVHDSPVVLWMVAEPHTDFSAVRLPSTRQSLGWGMRRDDQALQTAVNAQLALWKNDGFLQQTLEKWLGKDYQSLLE